MPSSAPESQPGMTVGALASAMERFDFNRHTFAFANELLWEYHFDAATGRTTFERRNPPPQYAHHCFVLVRSARQFLFHARFDANQPALASDSYRRLVRMVVSRSPRRPSRFEDRIVIPGYDCLREFSQAQESVLKQECGGAWQSYCLRSHWRMIFPFSRRRESRVFEELIGAIGQGQAPIVHVLRFPQLTINHGLLLFDCSEEKEMVRFVAYDPNVSERPAEIIYSRADRTFTFPPNHYWAGGRVDVFQIYCGWFY